MPGALEKEAHDRLKEAEYFAQHGDVEAALVCYSKAIFLSPKNASLFVRKAEAYVRLADYHSAIFNYRRALRLVQGQQQKWNSRLSQLLHVSGRSHLDRGEFQHAVSLALSAMTTLLPPPPLLFLSHPGSTPQSPSSRTSRKRFS